MTAPATSDDVQLRRLLDRIDIELTALLELLPYVEQLLEPVRGQRAMLRPKPTPEEEQRLAEQIQEERWDQVENERNRRPTPGKSPAPLSIAAVDVAVHVSMALVTIERRMWRHLAACALPGQGTDQARLGRIRRHLDLIVDERVAQAILDDATAAGRDAALLVDGEPNRRLNARCPYCHRETLVVYQRDPRRTKSILDDRTPNEVIRCDKAPNDDCYCPSETCPCKREKFEGRQTYRHTWTRDRGGWDALASLLNKHAANCRICGG